MQDNFEHFSQKMTYFMHLYAIFFILESLLIEFEGKWFKCQVTTLWIIARMAGNFFFGIYHRSMQNFFPDQSSNSNFENWTKGSDVSYL